MAQGSQQFTPSQILEAGRRAEAEGRIEYAIQFYRHLTDHLGRTTEAATAREALARLGATVGPAPANAPPGGKINGHAHATMPAPTQPLPGTQPAMMQQPTAAASLPGRPPAPVAGTGTQIVPRPSPAPAHAEQISKRRLILPKSRRRYRSGRFLARIFTLLGAIDIAVGLAFIVGGLIGRLGPSTAALPEFLASQQALLGGTVGVSLVFVGLVLVLFGQIARALFDTASASRDNAAFARARALYDGAVPEEQPPEG